MTTENIKIRYNKNIYDVSYIIKGTNRNDFKNEPIIKIKRVIPINGWRYRFALASTIINILISTPIV